MVAGISVPMIPIVWWLDWVSGSPAGSDWLKSTIWIAALISSAVVVSLFAFRRRIEYWPRWARWGITLTPWIPLLGFDLIRFIVGARQFWGN